MKYLNIPPSSLFHPTHGSYASAPATRRINTADRPMAFPAPSLSMVIETASEIQPGTASSGTIAGTRAVLKRLKS